MISKSAVVFQIYTKLTIMDSQA